MYLNPKSPTPAGLGERAQGVKGFRSSLGVGWFVFRLELSRVAHWGSLAVAYYVGVPLGFRVLQVGSCQNYGSFLGTLNNR